MFQVKELLSRMWADDEKGQTLIEYALIVLLNFNRGYRRTRIPG